MYVSISRNVQMELNKNLRSKHFLVVLWRVGYLNMPCPSLHMDIGQVRSNINIYICLTFS